ncbi:uncharacterized protein [Henckelia pumila]|uniref:uncharacterized protein n=1 Tax=Henckelia pumila TaxID=405737 RepID=UPI003C6E6CB8
MQCSLDRATVVYWVVRINGAQLLNVASLLKNAICETLGVVYTTNHGHYLGLPSLIGRNKIEVFDFIKEKVWKRMNGWRQKFLSRAGKVRNFLWRTLLNFLPTMTARKYRKVDVFEWCPICHHEPEDPLHALVSCPLILNIWSLTSIGSHVSNVSSILEWWNNLVISSNSSEIIVATEIMWSVWKNRNDVVWNRKGKSPAMIFYSAMELRTCWVGITSQTTQPPSFQLQNAFSRWTPPPTTHLKCNVNVDVALFTKPPHMGFECLLRNSGGTVLAAIHGRILGFHEPTIAEEKGIREALRWIKRQQLSHIIFESDSLLFINALQDSSPNLFHLGLIVDDCKYLARDLQSCSFVFVKRSANHAAHAL